MGRDASSNKLALKTGITVEDAGIGTQIKRDFRLLGCASRLKWESSRGFTNW